MDHVRACRLCLSSPFSVTGMCLSCRTLDAVSAFIQAPAPQPRMLHLSLMNSVRDKDPLSHNPDGSPRFLLVHKDVYGDPESNKQIFNLLSGILRDYDFKPADPSGCILVFNKYEGIIIIALIVDNFLNRYSCQIMYQKYLNYVIIRLETDD